METIIEENAMSFKYAPAVRRKSDKLDLKIRVRVVMARNKSRQSIFPTVSFQLVQKRHQCSAFLPSDRALTGPSGVSRWSTWVKMGWNPVPVSALYPINFRKLKFKPPRNSPEFWARNHHGQFFCVVRHSPWVGHFCICSSPKDWEHSLLSTSHHHPSSRLQHVRANWTFTVTHRFWYVDGHV